MTILQDNGLEDNASDAFLREHHSRRLLILSSLNSHKGRLCFYTNFRFTLTLRFAVTSLDGFYFGIYKNVLSLSDLSVRKVSTRFYLFLWSSYAAGKWSANLWLVWPAASYSYSRAPIHFYFHFHFPLLSCGLIFIFNTHSLFSS